MSYNFGNGMSFGHSLPGQTYLDGAQKRDVFLGLPGAQLTDRGGVISSAARDANHTGYTTTLRAGLVLGIVTATGEYKEWDPDGTDGSEIARAILGETVNVNIGGVDTDRTPRKIITSGVIDPKKVIVPGQTAPGMEGIAGEFAIAAQLSPNFTFGYLPEYNVGNIESRVLHKTATADIARADVNHVIDNLGASGDITLTLPNPAAYLGAQLIFRCVHATNDLIVADPATGDLVEGGSTLATVTLTPSGEEVRIVAMYIGASVAWVVTSNTGASA